jgi:hypothetical protein
MFFNFFTRWQIEQRWRNSPSPLHCCSVYIGAAAAGFVLDAICAQTGVDRPADRLIKTNAAKKIAGHNFVLEIFENKFLSF